MSFLFHPAHRKFIKLLRSYADKGVNYIITEDDKRRYEKIFERSTKAKDRHQSIYKFALDIINRETPIDKASPFDHSVVDQIEVLFANVERKNPWKTFKGAFILPIILFLMKKLKKRN